MLELTKYLMTSRSSHSLCASLWINIIWTCLQLLLH